MIGWGAVRVVRHCAGENGVVVKGPIEDRSATVLIVEDDRDTADALIRHARQSGFRPLHAANGLLAVVPGKPLRETGLAAAITFWLCA